MKNKSQFYALKVSNKFFIVHSLADKVTCQRQKKAEMAERNDAELKKHFSGRQGYYRQKSRQKAKPVQI